MAEQFETGFEKPFWDCSDFGFDEYRRLLIDSHWNAQEVANDEKMRKDVEDIKNVSSDCVKHIKSILFFFTIGDDAILKFIPEVVSSITDSSWKSYEIQKMAQEDIHAETYRKQFDYIAPDEILDWVQNIKKFKFMRRKITWCECIFAKNPTLAKTVYVFVILELIFFSSSFASIFWYKEQNLFGGIAFGNELIARDESLHGECGIYAYNSMSNKLTQKKAYKLISDAVEIECEFAREITPTSIGINPNMMRQHVQSIADYILIRTGFEPLYGNKKSPFDFMVKYGISRRVDFFQKKSSEYSSFVEEKFSLLTLLN